MRLRELEDLQSGAIRKATLAAGEGGASPATGDLVRPRILPRLLRRRGTGAPERPVKALNPALERRRSMCMWWCASASVCCRPRAPMRAARACRAHLCWERAAARRARGSSRCLVGPSPASAFKPRTCVANAYSRAALACLVCQLCVCESGPALGDRPRASGAALPVDS